MWTNSQFPVDLVTFTEETLNGKLRFLFSCRRSKLAPIRILGSQKVIDVKLGLNQPYFTLKLIFFLFVWVFFCFLNSKNKSFNICRGLRYLLVKSIEDTDKNMSHHQSLMVNGASIKFGVITIYERDNFNFHIKVFDGKFCFSRINL